MNNKAENGNVSLVEKMREEREISTVAFMNFVNNCKKFPNHAFCFFEGEDGKYYNQKIESAFGNEFMTIICGNKSEVLKVWRRLKDDSYYERISKLFFVDNDMDEIPEDVDKNLYVTPCYSIENLYVNKEAFEKILQSEFFLNKCDEDFEKCINLFEKLLDEFNENILEFNAYVLIRKMKNLGNAKTSLNNFKVGQVFKIDFNGIEKSAKYDEQINKLKETLETTEEELSEAINELKVRGNYTRLFRGKNQLDFLGIIIELLKKNNCENGFFKTKIPRVNINITKNRLSELSKYAIFPSCLKDFLETKKIPM